MDGIDNNELRDRRRKQPIVIAKEYAIIFLALCPFAMMVNWIFVPHYVVGGGLTGLCSIIYYITQGWFTGIFPEYGGALPIWLTSLVINLILLLIAALTVGWRFCIRTLFGVTSLSFWYRIIPIRDVAIIEDPIVACVVGGIFFGLSLGVVMLNNGSSGGTDILAMIVNKYRDVSLGTAMVVCDLVIIMGSYFLPIPDALQGTIASVDDYRIQRVMCGMIMAVSYTFSLDWLVHRVRRSVRFMIVSPKYEEIANAINSKVNRGVTILDGQGWFSHQPVHAIYLLARHDECQMVYRTVFEIDPNAMVTESDVSTVYGRGFDHYKGKR